MSTHTRPNAFSLVELSIVLVILGLLTGGILAGQSLIRASELRAVSTESQRYMTALSSFKDKYFSLPGDMSNATSFGTTWIGNGDADGTIEMTTTATTNEASLAWIHLGQAGLVEGNYTNVAATSTSLGAMTAGTNNPRSKMNNAGWNLTYLGTVTTTPTTSYWEGNYGNALFFGAGTSVATSVAPSGAGIMKSEEAWNVDTKMDDGKPATGSLLTPEAQSSSTGGSGCGNIAPVATSGAAAAYDLANTSSSACSLVLKSGY